MIGNSGHSYQERIKTIKNDGEYLFEKFCMENACRFDRIGFDEHQRNVPNYWRLSDPLRNLPDYVINTHDDKTFVVCVKGTDKLKRNEYTLLPLLQDLFGSEEAPLMYAFCFKENDRPIWKNPDQIIDLYRDAHDEMWHDGVIYRNLKLRIEHDSSGLANAQFI